MLVLCLLGGTAAAFAVTQNEKQRPSPIFRTHVDRTVAPRCGCEGARAEIAFALRRQGRLRLEIVGGGETVRVLVRDRRFGRGFKVFHWNGRDAAGRVVPDGDYAPHARFDGREFPLPNTIRVDTVPPRAKVVGVRLRPRAVRIRYRVSERAHVLVFAGGRRIVRGRWQRLADAVEVPLAALAGGRRLWLAAEDTAGNVGPRVPVELPA